MRPLWNLTCVLHLSREANGIDRIFSVLPIEIPFIVSSCWNRLTYNIRIVNSIRLRKPCWCYCQTREKSLIYSADFSGISLTQAWPVNFSDIIWRKFSTARFTWEQDTWWTTAVCFGVLEASPTTTSGTFCSQVFLHSGDTGQLAIWKSIRGVPCIFIHRFNLTMSCEKSLVIR